MLKDEGLKSLARDMLGMAEQDMAKVTPTMEREMKNIVAALGKYRLVAEVVNSKYCFAALQPGQTFVVELDGKINPQESTAPLCLGALGPLGEKSRIMMDRISQNGDITAPIAGFRCGDPGLDLGGLGSVDFTVRIEKLG